MRATVIAMLLLVGCRERGTIDIPLVEQCTEADVPAYDSAAVYFFRNARCDSFGCESPTCDEGAHCYAACDAGYCSVDELDALTFDPDPGDYAVVVRFHYPDQPTDGSYDCYEIQVDADGDTNSTGPLMGGRCCRGTQP